MDNLFFWISKLTWLIISPDSLLLLLVLLSFVFLYLKKYKITKIILGSLSVVLITLAFIPIGEWLLYPLESRFQTNPSLPDKVDGIIVLSGSEDPLLSDIWKQVELGGTAERNLAFIALARQFPEAKLVFTGGTGSLTHQKYKAADIAKILFQQQGLDLQRVIFERESRNTYENAVYSYHIVSPKAAEKWVLITTAWHMPRSVGIFCKANWPVIPYPVDHQTQKGHLFRLNFDLSGNLVAVQTAFKEWLGLLAYRVSDKTTALLPAQCS